MRWKKVRDILKLADAQKTSVYAFDAPVDLNTIEAVVQGAERAQKPVIVYALSGDVRRLARRASLPKRSRSVRAGFACRSVCIWIIAAILTSSSPPFATALRRSWRTVHCCR